MNSEVGSIWRKWDLHVHTPESIENHFPGISPEEKWDKYIQDLESLPQEVKVIGINDYVFIDGYKKVMEYKHSGRLSNIDTIFPVIEFRIKKFAGHSAFKRVNFHVIFSENIGAEVIQSQFLSGLQGKYQLAPGLSGVRWNALITKASLSDFGRQIKETIHEDQREHFGSDLSEGFNNLNLNEEEIIDLLSKNSYLEGNYLTAVGKTEWDSLPWGESTIAEKKDIINKSDMVFISSENLSNYFKAKKKLIEQQVNPKLLDCSDAHYPKSSSEKERIGKCFTWLKADTTFAGLKQALLEFEDRVFVGEKPPSIQLVQGKPNKFIKSLSIRKISDSEMPESWFDGMPTIPLNTQLVAIIGNKGGGKSAIADILGLKGNAHCSKEFSFLSANKFLRKKPYERAANFEASIEWMSNQSEPFTPLNAQIDKLSPQKVKYLPQSYIETICTNEIEGSTFENEIESAIFSHIPIQDRLGKSSFKEFLSLKSLEIISAINSLNEQLANKNLEIIDSESKIHPDYIHRITTSLEENRQTLATHIAAKPVEVSEPTENSASPVILAKLQSESSSKQELQNQLQLLIGRNSSLSISKTNLENAIKILDNMLSSFEKEKIRLSQLLNVLGIEANEIVTISLDKTKIHSLIDSVHSEIVTISPQIDASNPDGIPSRILHIDENIRIMTEQLSLPNKEYQEYIQALRNWESRKQEIIGNRETPDTIANFEAWQSYITKDLPKIYEQQKNQRSQLASQIFRHKIELIEIYKSAYSPIMRLVTDNRALMEDYKLNFTAELTITNFEDRFLNFINQGAKGTFSGKEEGYAFLKEKLQECDFSTIDSALEFVSQITDYLGSDARASRSGEKRYLIEQLKKGINPVDVYNFIYGLEYLLPTFKLRLGTKELSELSPGERGALLLIFYLLLDKSDVPLIIDQPEENLDNQSVYNIVVKFIKKAKEIRQVIIVTHNPNLAVVCDSEQVIRVCIDKENGNKFSWIAGAIENPTINDEIVRILEGTMPAFTNRKHKYENTLIRM